MCAENNTQTISDLYESDIQCIIILIKTFFALFLGLKMRLLFIDIQKASKWPPNRVLIVFSFFTIVVCLTGIFFRYLCFLHCGRKIFEVNTNRQIKISRVKMYKRQKRNENMFSQVQSFQKIISCSKFKLGGLTRKLQSPILF